MGSSVTQLMVSVQEIVGHPLLSLWPLNLNFLPSLSKIYVDFLVCFAIKKLVVYSISQCYPKKHACSILLIAMTSFQIHVGEARYLLSDTAVHK